MSRFGWNSKGAGDAEGAKEDASGGIVRTIEAYLMTIGCLIGENRPGKPEVRSSVKIAGHPKRCDEFIRPCSQPSSSNNNSNYKKELKNIRSSRSIKA